MRTLLNVEHRSDVYHFLHGIALQEFNDFFMTMSEEGDADDKRAFNTMLVDVSVYFVFIFIISNYFAFQTVLEVHGLYFLGFDRHKQDGWSKSCC